MQLACPEGKIELPIDLWKCKLTGQLCPLQAFIDTEHWTTFHEHCLAPQERQQGIRQAISTGQYHGFHHVLGRYLCPMCKPSRRGRWHHAYHYPWELHPLERFVPYDSEELRLQLLQRDVSITAQSAPLCGNCLNTVLDTLELPSLDAQLQHRGYGEPMNEDEPLSFHMYRSVIERESGNKAQEGECAWCEATFAWNESGECIYYDIHSVTSPTGDRGGFRLCELCGERFARLFEIRD